jgi:hypothetical protein
MATLTKPFEGYDKEEFFRSVIRVRILSIPSAFRTRLGTCPYGLSPPTYLPPSCVVGGCVRVQIRSERGRAAGHQQEVAQGLWGAASGGPTRACTLFAGGVIAAWSGRSPGCSAGKGLMHPPASWFVTRRAGRRPTTCDPAAHRWAPPAPTPPPALPAVPLDGPTPHCFTITHASSCVLASLSSHVLAYVTWHGRVVLVWSCVGWVCRCARPSR